MIKIEIDHSDWWFGAFYNREIFVPFCNFKSYWSYRFLSIILSLHSIWDTKQPGLWGNLFTSMISAFQIFSPRVFLSGFHKRPEVIGPFCASFDVRINNQVIWMRSFKTLLYQLETLYFYQIFTRGQRSLSHLLDESGPKVGVWPVHPWCSGSDLAEGGWRSHHQPAWNMFCNLSEKMKCFLTPSKKKITKIVYGHFPHYATSSCTMSMCS